MTLVEITWPASGRRHGEDKEAEKREEERRINCR